MMQNDRKMLYVLAQVGAADKALGYLGINTRTNALGFRIPAAVGAAVAEAGQGFASALVAYWQRTDEWAYATYWTGARLHIPGPFGGKVDSWRTAVNATWTPVTGLSFSLEGGYARVRSSVALVPSGNAKTVLITLTKSME
jgi:hypothetical protein